MIHYNDGIVIGYTYTLLQGLWIIMPINHRKQISVNRKSWIDQYGSIG